MSDEWAEKPVLKLDGENLTPFRILNLARKVAVHNFMDWDEIRYEMTEPEADIMEVARKYFDIQ